MPSKLTRSRLRHWQRQFVATLLTRQRWWEAGVISVCLAASAVALYWWLWRPVARNGTTVTSPNAQLDIAVIKELTEWADEREQRKASSGVEERFNELFK